MTRSVTLVVGPPCSGKSTYVEQHAQPDDLVLCVDTFAQEAGSPVTHSHEGKYWQAGEKRFQELCDELNVQKDITAWVIRSVPESEEREELALRIGATSVIVLLPELYVAYERALNRADVPDIDVPATIRAISSWFRRYRPSPIDEVIHA